MSGAQRRAHSPDPRRKMRRRGFSALEKINLGDQTGGWEKKRSKNTLPWKDGIIRLENGGGD